jgi:hypothetical protein
VEAHETLRIASELVQKDVREKVEGLVTEGLRRVFGRDERFYFEIEVKRGRMTAVPMIERTINGVPRSGEVRRCFGGGVADVTAFLLQIVFLVLTPATPRTFLADEPFRNVSRDFLPRVANMLEWLRDVTKIQFVIVTHQPEIAAVADREFKVTQNDAGASEMDVA